MSININARFWIWWNNDWVKITLKPGQTISYSKYYHTEEGWGSESETLTHGGKYLYREYTTDGSDCDGRLSSYQQDRCPTWTYNYQTHVEYFCDHCDRSLSESYYGVPQACPDRRHRFVRKEFYLSPCWERVKSGQRDYTAEAAGY